MNFYLIYTKGKNAEGKEIGFYSRVTEESKERAKSKLYYYLKKQGFADLDMQRCTQHKTPERHIKYL